VKQKRDLASGRRSLTRRESKYSGQHADREIGAPKAPRLRLRVTAAAQSILRSGHPWVFAESVREQNRDGVAGELAVIYDRNDQFLAVGLFDPDSPIRVRILHRGKPETIDAAWWAAHLAQAVGRRQNLFDERTTGYRLINGESDGWPGLVLDRYDTTLVLKVYTMAWRPRLEEIIGLIRERLQPERIVLRLSRNIQRAAASPPLTPHPGPLPRRGGEGESAATRLRIWRDGEAVFLKRAGPEAGAPGPTGDQRADQEIGAPIVFLETGLKFESDVWRGQKTGFFLDQRENRRMVESQAQGRRVLNAFSFSGGFSLYAARGGASSVTDLDISAHALAGARRNFALNNLEPAVARCEHELIQADTFEWLEKSAPRHFDLIILDPPSFAKREAERANALRAYEKLSALGIARLSRGGILVSCSCSAHVSVEEFFEAVRRAAKKSGREFSEMRTTRHAPDHTATFKEAEYLKAIYLGFS
jgi:23S rRNA (cytosine1962-C5)-methyltransferase